MDVKKTTTSFFFSAVYAVIVINNLIMRGMVLAVLYQRQLVHRTVPDLTVL